MINPTSLEEIPHGRRIYSQQEITIQIFFYLSCTLTKGLLTEASAEKKKSRKTMMFRRPEKNTTVVWHHVPDPMKGVMGGHP